jgi:hypothetical protein
MDDMKTLRRPAKVDLILSMFDEVGAKASVKDVCAITGVKNYNSLKAMFSYIRKASHIPEENRIDVRIRDDQCLRVN